MYKELHKEAKKKVQAKLSFYTCAIVFFFSTILLIMLSFYLPDISFWLMLPIPAFLMVLGVVYITAFGLSFKRNSSIDWQEEEIEKEMLKLYRQKRVQLPPLETLSDLKLKKLERLQNREEDFV